MCGIAGYWAADGYRPERSILESMCDAIAHRGPDGDGYYVDGHVALGHRRLSIIDLAGGAQPIGNEDGSIQIVFNGEIYNFRDLRTQLVQKGHHFQTQSDTEVIVHLYEDVGERLPAFLDGMFAFAIWDKRARTLFLARDRFGKKPLYYGTDVAGARFAFASELKALARMPKFSEEVRSESVAQFLALSYIPDPLTIYQDIHKLPPGHVMVVDGGGVRVFRYWQPEFQGAASHAQVQESMGALRHLASSAVEKRLMSDVPLGAFLSGGVDSSAVVALMSGAAPNRVKTFSIGFNEPEFDELCYARLLVERYNTDHYEEVVTPSVHEIFDVLVKHFDEPFGDPSAIPMLYLSRMTAKHVKVALSGDGADEIFGGYRRYYWNVCESRLRSLFPEWFRRSIIRLGAQHYPSFEYLPRVFRAKATLNFLANELGSAYFTHMSVFRDMDVTQFLSPEFRASLDGYSPREHFQRRFERWSHLHPLQQMQAADLETYLPGDILTKVDRATMAYSIEARCPWLDHHLAELSFRLPADFNLRKATGKYLFKQTVAPLVPEELIARPKKGFSVPLAAWFRTSLKPIFERLVLRDEMAKYLALRPIRTIWLQHQSGAHNHERKLWNFLMLAAWDDLYFNKSRLFGNEATVGA